MKYLKTGQKCPSFLFDPNLGLIEMNIEKFNEIYTGTALIINDIVSSDTILLNDDELRNIKAKGWRLEYYYQPGYFYLDYYYLDFGGTWIPYVYWDWNVWQFRWSSYYLDFGGVWVPYLRYVPGYYVPYYSYVPDAPGIYANTIVVANSSDIRDSNTFNPNNVYPNDGKSYKINYNKYVQFGGGLCSLLGGVVSGQSWAIIGGMLSFWNSLYEPAWVPVE